MKMTNDGNSNVNSNSNSNDDQQTTTKILNSNSSSIVEETDEEGGSSTSTSGGGGGGGDGDVSDESSSQDMIMKEKKKDYEDNTAIASSGSHNQTAHHQAHHQTPLYWPEDSIIVDESSSSNKLKPNVFILLVRWTIRMYTIWTYSYMNVILRKGAAASKHHNQNGNDDSKNSSDDDYHLTSDDLYPVPREMKSLKLVSKFESYWEKLVNNSKNNTKSKNTKTPPNITTKTILLKTLWYISKPTYVPAGIYQLVSTLCISTMPLVVRQLLYVLEDESGNVNVIQEGLIWCCLLTFMTFINGLSNHRHRHQSMKTGIAIRSATVNIIYKHVLLLSPVGKSSLTSGEITNLVAVDCQKLYEVTQEGHLIWALPLSILLVTWFLCYVMGPSTLVGIVVLIAFLPIINLVTKQMTKVRSQRVKLSDERVEITCSMLMGIRSTKLNGYETKYKQRVEDVRSKELSLLAKEQAWWATTLVMTVSSPVLATGATFATYVLTTSSTNQHILTAADTFGVLLLFGALRFPINFAGRLIGKAAQALSAVRRISSFLQRPLRHDNDTDTDKHDIADTTTTTRSSTITAATATTVATIVDVAAADKGDDDVVPLRLSHARFRVGKAPEEEPTEEEEEEVVENGGVGCTSNDGLSFTAGDFSFELRKGQVLVVCGPVGSGKSTLINGILDEADRVLNHRHRYSTETNTTNDKHAPSSTTKTKGTMMVQKHGQYSYAPQDPFILNQSLRENILFGTPLNEKRYNAVLDACALRPDIQQLGGSDLIQIGERGVTLSGGQRQRISLARAAYKAAQSSSSCIILDDPFSALDAGTGKIVFERLIASPQALLKNSAVLLVTHASHFISHRSVDQILLMVNGRNQFMGTWDELTKFESSSSAVDDCYDEPTRRAVDHIQSQVRENTHDNGEDDERNDNRKKKTKGDTTASSKVSTTNKDHHKVQQQQQKNNKIMQRELREHGLSSFKTWLLWFQRAGGICYIVTVFVLLLIDRSAYVCVEWFLAVWATGAYTEVAFLGFQFEPQINGLSAQYQYLKVYAIIVAISLFSTALRSEFTVTGGVRATKNVFNGMLGSVLRAPMSYFETVPMGRILNRFTYDTDVNDVTLTQVISMFIISCSWYVASIVVQVAILPWSAFVLFPISGLYLLLMHHYRHTGPDLQRIDALSRSPLQSMVSECLEGSTSIRIFHQDRNFITKFENIVDVNSSALLNYVSVQRWLGIRMEVLGSLVVLTTSVLVVCLNEQLNTTAGLAGLLITWTSNFTITLNFLVDTFSETEAAITAIERVDAMAELPSERSMETETTIMEDGSSINALSKSWPQQGLLEFKNVFLRYRDGLPLALNDLSFEIPAGKTCGIVGRTGAGKSSITVALFRLVEIESGQILLDGIDLSTLGLSDVRGRGMSIIPQDPFLAGANLRECLDPFEQRTDGEIMEALQSVRMGSSTATTEVLLSMKLEEGGSNYSVGERQLLNLARALLSQPKVLVLDEATASIDGETDAFIQRMLRTRFPNTTLVTIAHRLNTVMDYDCVLVMDNGRASEFDSPTNLLSNEEGIFSQLVDATGIESSKALRQMAVEASASKL